MVVKNAWKNPCLPRKNTQTNSIPPFQQNPPFLGSQFFHPPFLGIFGKVNPPPLKRGGERGGWNYVGSLVFSDFLHGGSWPWYLVTAGARFLKKKLVTRILTNWAKIRPQTSFFLFSQVCFIRFYNNSF